MVCSAAPDPVAPSDPNVQNQPVPGRQTAEERWAIDHLVVVAGPPAVGKSRLIRRLARDDLLRERLGVPKDAPALAARAVPRRRPTAHEALILHYDLGRGLRAFAGRDEKRLKDMVVLANKKVGDLSALTKEPAATFALLERFIRNNIMAAERPVDILDANAGAMRYS